VKKIAIILVIIVIHQKAPSQDCAGKDLSKMTGSWKQNPLVNPKDPRRPDLLAKEKVICNNILDLIRSNFKAEPIGGDLFYSHPDGCLSATAATTQEYPISANLKTAPFLYGPSFDMLRFDCDHGKLGHIPAALLYMYITINQIPVPFRFSESFFVSRMDVNGNNIEKDPQTDRYGFAPVLPEQNQTYLDYTNDQIDGNGNYENHVVDRYRMIFKTGLFPFLPMTKKEYYQKWKKKYLQTMKAKDEVIDAKAGEVKNISGGDKILQQLRQEAHYSETKVQKIDAILNAKLEQQLAMTAIAGEEQGEYYEQIAPNTDHAVYIIKANPAYHNPALPLYAPQLISIHYHYYFGKQNQIDDYRYDAQSVYRELERMNVFDLLTKFSTSVIVR
jgi:hypothetical protein